MKKGKYFLKHIFTMAFCLVASAICSTSLVHATNNFSCYDKDTKGMCTTETTDGYVVVNRFEVNDETNVVIPSTQYFFGKNFNVEQIASNAIVSNKGDEVLLDLNEIVLPDHLVTIKSHAFNNVNSLNELRFPKTLLNIEKDIFRNNAKIKNAYLNHDEVNIDDHGAILKKTINIAKDAFGNIDLDLFKLVAGSMDVYSSLTTKEGINENLKGVSITTLVNYKFHTYANTDKDDILITKQYYIGDGFTINDLPIATTPDQLDFIGWYYYTSDSKEKEIIDGSNVYFESRKDTYEIYPKFELKEINFDIQVNSLTQEYNGFENLITLKINPEQLNVLEGIISTVKWYKTFNNAQETFIKEGNDLSLYKVKESGNYVCKFTYQFTDTDGSVYTKTISKPVEGKITILPHKLYVKTSSISKEYGTYLTQEDIHYTYDGLLNNDKIPTSGISVEFPNSGDIQSGLYNDAIKTVILEINCNGESVISNYDIDYSHGDYIVLNKVFHDILFNEVKEFEYGYDTQIKYEFTDMAYQGYEHNVTVIFKREKGNDVGEYKVTGIESISNPNYTVNLDVNSEGKVKIVPRKVNLVHTLGYYTYDKKVKETYLYYIDIDGNRVDVEPKYYFNNEVINYVLNAGRYLVINDDLGDPNYKVNSEQHIQFEIAKANPHPVYNENQSFVYNGKAVVPTISIDNDEQTPIYEYTNSSGHIIDECKKVGVYNINVTYKESDNYLEFTTKSRNPIRVAIIKYIINLNPREFITYYGNTPKLEEKININGETVVVKYDTTANKESSIGDYDITRAIIYEENGIYEHDNYKGVILNSECKGKVKVAPRPATINYYNYSNLFYDGNTKSIGAYLIDDETQKVIRDIDITVYAYEGCIKNAGKYHINATINDERYKISNTSLMEINIAKGTYNLNDIKFIGRKFIFDFTKHSISIEGKLPEGVTVEYSINGKPGNASSGFEHIVTANFIVDENNYNPIESMSAVIKVDMTWLFVVIICLILAIGAGVCGGLLYHAYRREHPRKIKLRIKNMVDDDLAAKRVATTVKEVLGDSEKKENGPQEIIENDDDLVDDKDSTDSFIERIYAADSELKYYYSEVKNEILSYEGITHTVDRKYEVFYHGTKLIAKLSICNNILRLYVDLDPNMYSKEEYNHRDMSEFECHKQTPLRINVDSMEALRHAKVFIRIVRKHEKLEAVSGFARVDYEKFYILKENFFPSIIKDMFKSKPNKKDKEK